MLSELKSKLAALVRSWPLAAVAVTAAALRLVDLVYDATPRIPRLDFSGFYVWAWAMRRQIDPYQVDLTPYAQTLHIQIDAILRANYPPTFILLFEPFTHLEPWTASVVWACLTAVLFVAALVLLVSTSKTTPLPAALTIISLAILYRPVKQHFIFLQVQILSFFLLVVMWRALLRGREIAAGGVLALAGLIKVYPLFLMLYLVCTRKWRALTFTIIFLAIGFVLTVAMLGPRSFGFFQTAAFHMTPSTGTPIAPRIGLDGAIVRLYLRFDPTEKHSSLVLARKLLEAILELAVLSVTALAILRSKANPLKEQYAFGLCIASMILCYPNSWSHYMVLLLFPLCQIAIASEAGLTSPTVSTLAAIAYVLAELSITTAYRSYRHNHMQLGMWLIEGLVVSTVITYVATYLLIVGERPAKIAAPVDKPVPFSPLASQRLT